MTQRNARLREESLIFVQAYAVTRVVSGPDAAIVNFSATHRRNHASGA